METRILFLADMDLTGSRGVLGGGGFSAEELAELHEILVRTRDHMDGDDFANRAGGGGTRFDSGFHGGDRAGDKDGDIAGADFFPADEVDIGGFEHRVRRFELRHEALGFDHSECLVSHKMGFLKIRR